MNLDPTPLQQELVQAVTRLLQRECDTARVRLAEASGFDPALWHSLVELGMPSMGLAEEHGGIGADLLDIALIAECHGRFLAPVPLIETVVGYRALERCSSEAAGELLRRLTGEGAPLAIALDNSNGDGERLTAGGSAAAAVVVMDERRLMVFEHPAPVPMVPNLGAMPLAYRSFRTAKSCVLVADGVDAEAIHQTLLLEWQVLTAAALAGLGRAGLELGVNYVKERQAFGQPIGAFQAVAHRLADAATLIEGACLIGRAAAAAAQKEPDRFPVLSKMALAWSAEAAQQATADSLHVHGGYGFTLEYDIQLYVRRAKAWPLVLGEPTKRYAAIGGAMAAQPERLRRWIFN
jgi:alkylation response protein AidB-like acyl-CoA dehydrogenase